MKVGVKGEELESIKSCFGRKPSPVHRGNRCSGFASRWDDLMVARDMVVVGETAAWFVAACPG